MFGLDKLDKLDKLFILWAFLLQSILIVHFAIRKTYFESYTLKYGWIVYAMCIPAAVISIILLRAGKEWSFWLGGFLFVAFALFGYWVDYVAGIQFRNPVRVSVLIPYIVLYLGTIAFYWWPVGFLSRPLWYVYTVLFVIATILNVTSH
jgi:hypothetical protein